jgi:hypothetical protein
MTPDKVSTRSLSCFGSVISLAKAMLSGICLAAVGKGDLGCNEAQGDHGQRLGKFVAYGLCSQHVQVIVTMRSAERLCSQLYQVTLTAGVTYPLSSCRSGSMGFGKASGRCYHLGAQQYCLAQSPNLDVLEPTFDRLSWAYKAAYTRVVPHDKIGSVLIRVYLRRTPSLYKFG